MNRYKLYKAGVDVNDVLYRLGDDKELYEQLLLTYKNESHIEKLEKAIADNDAKEAFSVAHAMKGECGNMGFSRLYDALNKLVEKLRVEDMSDIEPIMNEIKEAHNLIIEAIG